MIRKVKSGMSVSTHKLPGRSPLIREAEIQGASVGSIGGFFWDSQKIIEERKLPPESLARFNYLVQGGSCTITINKVHTEIPLHIHKLNDEMQYYIEGRGEFRISNERLTIKPGIVTYVPKGTVHGGPISEPVTLLAVFAPNFDIKNPDRVFVDENGNEFV